MFTQLTKKAVPIQLYTMFSSPSKQNRTQKKHVFSDFLWKILLSGFFLAPFLGWVFAIYPKAPNEALKPEGGEAKFKAKPSWMTTRSSGKHNVIASHGVFFLGERRGRRGGELLQKKRGTQKKSPKLTQCHFFSFLLGQNG